MVRGGMGSRGLGVRSTRDISGYRGIKVDIMGLSRINLVRG